MHTRKLKYFTTLFLALVLLIPACSGNGIVIVVERDNQGDIIRTVSVRASGTLHLQIPTSQEFTPREEAVFIRGSRTPSIVEY